MFQAASGPNLLSKLATRRDSAAHSDRRVPCTLLGGNTSKRLTHIACYLPPQLRLSAAPALKQALPLMPSTTAAAAGNDSAAQSPEQRRAIATAAALPAKDELKTAG